MKKIIALLLSSASLLSCALFTSGYSVRIHNPGNSDMLFVINVLDYKYSTGGPAEHDNLMNAGSAKKLKAGQSYEYSNSINSFDEKMVYVDYALADPVDSSNYTGKIYSKRTVVEANFHRIIELTTE